MKKLSFVVVALGLCASAWAGGQGGLSGGSLSGSSNSGGAQGNMRGTFANKKKLGKNTAGAGGSGTTLGTQTSAPLVSGSQPSAAPAALQSTANPPVPKTPVSVFGNNGFGLGNGSNSFGSFSGGTNKP